MEKMVKFKIQTQTNDASIYLSEIKDPLHLLTF